MASPAQALELEIVNQSGEPDSNVYVTVFGGGAYDVPGATNDQSQPLSSIPGGVLTVNQLVAGRVYISYGAGVDVSVPFTSPTRFHWAELTVTPGPADVANLTAVDQFAIALRLDTLDGSGQILETLSSANANTVFEALGEVPGGAAATLKDSGGQILRVLSPLHTASYPSLSGYLESMAGTRVTLHTAFYGNPFTNTEYSGRFGPDGSITLKGTTDPPGAAPASIAIEASQLLADIYTGGDTPNDAQGAIYRDLLSGFSAGFWGGRYGNDAIDFCNNPATTQQGSWCPSGFNQPSFGAARPNLASYAFCEQYAAVIDEYTDAYGNPYSDASKKVQIGLDQPGSGGQVEGLRLTILPDSGDSEPVEAGDSNCGAGSLADDAMAVAKRVTVSGRSAEVGSLTCPPACGPVRLKATAPALGASGGGAAPSAAARGQRRRVVARGHLRANERGTHRLKLKLNRAGKRRLAGGGRIRVRHLTKLRGSGELIDSRRHRLTLRRPRR